MKTAAFIIQSYPQLSNLYYWLEKNDLNISKNIIVIGNESLYKFLSKLNHINICFIPEPTFSYYNVKRWICIGLENRFTRLTHGHFDVIFFCSYEFVGILGPIIKSFAARGAKFVHMADPGCDVYTSRKDTRLGLSLSTRKLIDKFVYFNTVEYAVFTPELNRKYVRRLSKTLVRSANITINQKSFKGINSSRIPEDLIYTDIYENCKLVIILKEVVNNGLIEASSYVNTWAQILRVIQNIFSQDQVFIKPRPSGIGNLDQEIFKEFNILPGYVPFENIQLTQSTRVLGLSSTAMAKSKRNPISVYDLFQIRDKKKIDRSKQILKKRSQNVIINISTLDELYSELSNE